MDKVELYGRKFLEFLRDNVTIFDDPVELNRAWHDDDKWSYWNICKALRFFADECDVFLWDGLDEDLVRNLNGMYQNSDVKTIDYPGHLKLVPSFAFDWCKNLTKVTIEQGVETISDYSFSNSGVKEVELPDGLLKIYAQAFKGCGNLEKINLPKTLKYIQPRAFSGCNKLKEIEIPDGCWLRTEAFINCGLEKVILPKSLTHIPDSCFASTKLSDIDLPDGLTQIGDFAFSGTNIETIEIPQSVTYLGRYFFGTIKSDGKPAMPRQCKIKIRGLNKEQGREHFMQKVSTPSKAYQEGYLKKII